MKYYNEDEILSENLHEVSSDFAGIFVEDGFVIEVTPSPDKVYFKLMTGFPCYEDEDPANIKMTRISMIDTEYIKDTGDSWDLSDKEKNKLYEILTKDNNKLWNKIIASWNEEADSINDIFDIYIENRVGNISVPDYTKLK